MEVKGNRNRNNFLGGELSLFTPGMWMLIENTQILVLDHESVLWCFLMIAVCVCEGCRFWVWVCLNQLSSAHCVWLPCLKSARGCGEVFRCVCYTHTTPKTHASPKGAQSVHNALLFLLCSTVNLSPRWLGECPASSLCCLRPPPWPRCPLSCCHRIRQRYEPELAFSHPLLPPVPSEWHHFWFPSQNSLNQPALLPLFLPEHLGG